MVTGFLRKRKYDIRKKVDLKLKIYWRSVFQIWWKLQELEKTDYWRSLWVPKVDCIYKETLLRGFAQKLYWNLCYSMFNAQTKFVKDRKTNNILGLKDCVVCKRENSEIPIALIRESDFRLLSQMNRLSCKFASRVTNIGLKWRNWCRRKTNFAKTGSESPRCVIITSTIAIKLTFTSKFHANPITVDREGKDILSGMRNTESRSIFDFLALISVH